MSFSLVAYDSGSEDENEETTQEEIKIKSTIIITTPKAVVEDDDLSKGKSLFNLPQPLSMPPKISEEIGPIPPKKIYPSGSFGDAEDKKSFGGVVAKKVGGKIQIGIPSLKDFKDDVEEKSKKILNQAIKKSGLFAILPEPKAVSSLDFIKKNRDNNNSTANLSSSSTSDDNSSVPTSSKNLSALVPDSVRNKKAESKAKQDAIREKYAKKDVNIQFVSRKPVIKAEKRKHDSDNEDSDEESSEGFFSLDSKQVELSETDYSALKLPTPIEKPSTSFKISDQYEEEEDDDDDTPTEMDVDPAQIQAQEEELMKMIQRDTKREKIDKINFIDVNADSLKPESQLWLKTITDTTLIAPRKANLPGGLQKRKHQITYLALEAKAREEELQNKWAANRHSKRMTRNKYGF